MNRWLILLMVSGVLMTSAGFSQGIYLGPNVGIFKSNDGDESNVLIGAALRIKTSSVFGVEGSIAYRQEKFANEAITVKTWPVMVTAMLYPLPIAYGAMGAGWYNTTVEYDRQLLSVEDDSETSQEFGWHFGGGVELPLGKSTKLTGDIRYVFLDYDFKALPTSEEVNSNFYVINAGILWRL